MISHCPADSELAAALHVPEESLRSVLDDVSTELAAWSAEGESWLPPTAIAVTYTVLSTGWRSMALAFPDVDDLRRYLPYTLAPNVDIAVLNLRELLGLLLVQPKLDLVLLKPQDPEEEEEAGLYVGVQVERTRLLAAIFQRALLAQGGLGVLLASFLKWMNDQHPDSGRLLVAAAMARAAIDQKLLSFEDLTRRCGLDLDTVRVASREASQLFAVWWSAGTT